MGRVDTFADGLGEGGLLGTQLALLPGRPVGREVPGVNCGCEEVAWPESGAMPAEWRGPGAGWLVAGSGRGAGRAVPMVAGCGGPDLCGAGAATATWASC